MRYTKDLSWLIAGYMRYQSLQALYIHSGRHRVLLFTQREQFEEVNRICGVTLQGCHALPRGYWCPSPTVGVTRFLFPGLTDTWWKGLCTRCESRVRNPFLVRGQGALTFRGNKTVRINHIAFVFHRATSSLG
jgi:hypothetical protein